MMKYDFDCLIDRKKTDATKWTKYDSDILPMWIADMDLRVSSGIQSALYKRCEHPVFGYTDRGSIYRELFAHWFNKMHNYGVTADQVALSTGVVYSIGAAIRLLSEEGDEVLVLTPSYPPLMEAVLDNNRRLITYEMPLINEKYTIDFTELQKLVGEKTKLILLCNPHNPTGKVLDAGERRQMAAFCEANLLKIISDEIHADFVYDNEAFKPIMNETAYTRENTIACVSCTKTFNLAGLKVSAVFIKNRDLMQSFSKYLKTLGIHSINTMALEAVKACYQSSDDWYSQMMLYLKNNRDYLLEQISGRLPDIKTSAPDSTYFYWLDFENYELKDIHHSLIEHGRLGLREGAAFGDAFRCFERLTFAAPRSIIDEALNRLESFDKAVKNKRVKRM